MNRIIALLIIALLLVACRVPGTQSSPTPTEGLSPATQELATPVGETATESPSPPEHSEANIPAGVALVLRRSGGIAGVAEQWTVYVDGRVLAGDGGRWQASPERVSQLVSELEQLGFFELADRYIPLNTCCDRFTYELSVRSGARTHTITALEATPDVPDAVWRALDTVAGFIAEVE